RYFPAWRWILRRSAPYILRHSSRRPLTGLISPIFYFLKRAIWRRTTAHPLRIFFAAFAAPYFLHRVWLLLHQVSFSIYSIASSCCPPVVSLCLKPQLLSPFYSLPAEHYWPLQPCCAYRAALCTLFRARCNYSNLLYMDQHSVC